MNSQSPLRLGVMTSADLAAADELRRLAGWNQTRRDWERFIRCQPDGCFVAYLGDHLAGTATTICYETQLGWIGMLLVHPDYRRSGIGSGLLQHCIQYLQSQGVACLKLDATPLGKPLYDRFGFQAELSLTRWQRDGLELCASSDGPPAPSWTEADLEQIEPLDETMFGVSRGHLFRALFHQGPQVKIHRSSSGEALGFGMLRSGARAFYLGPVVAPQPAVAEEIIRELLARIPGQRVYWDILDDNAAATALARQLGFTPQRALLRMFHGANFGLAQPGYQYAMVDPAVG